MNPKEILRRKPKVETSQELLTQVVNKLIADLQNGYIVEDYDTRPSEDNDRNWDNESLKKDAIFKSDGFCVVLKGKRYFKIKVTRNHTGYKPDEQYLSVKEFASIEDMSDWMNASRTVGFVAPDEFFASRCRRYKYSNGEGWNQVVLEPESTVNLLGSILKAKVDKKATMRSFENDTAKAIRPKSSLQHIVRWPKLKTSS